MSRTLCNGMYVCTYLHSCSLIVPTTYPYPKALRTENQNRTTPNNINPYPNPAPQP